MKYLIVARHLIQLPFFFLGSRSFFNSFLCICLCYYWWCLRFCTSIENPFGCPHFTSLENESCKTTLQEFNNTHLRNSKSCIHRIVKEKIPFEEEERTVSANPRMGSGNNHTDQKSLRWVKKNLFCKEKEILDRKKVWLAVAVVLLRKGYMPSMSLQADSSQLH